MSKKVYSRKTDVGRTKVSKKRHRRYITEELFMEDKIYDAINSRAGFVAKNRERILRYKVDG
jgi:hypothetical protein